MAIGICKICGGDIVESFSLGASWYCKKCGVAYYTITKETATEEGKYLINR